MQYHLRQVCQPRSSELGCGLVWQFISTCVGSKVVVTFLTLSLTVLGSTGGQAAEKPKASAIASNYAVLLDGITSGLRDIRKSVDRSTFDPSALVDRLDYDANQIIEFVKSEIKFQAYPGVLRGAQGTLMSRSGNALDQAILTATLLKDAGYDARIVRAELNGDQARELLPLIAKTEPKALNNIEKQAIEDFAMSLKGIKPELDKSLDNFAKRLGGASALEASQAFQEIDATSSALLSRLPKRNEFFQSRDVTEELAKGIADYFWVEMREETSSRWKEVHPVFVAIPESFKTLKKLEHIEDSIPSALHQTVQISVSIVQKRGEKLSEHQVMSPWSRPVANLYGIPITFSNVSDMQIGMSVDAVDDNRRGEAELFFPQFNGQLAPGGLAFDLQGRVIPMEAAASHMAGIVKQVGDKTLQAADALSQLGAESDTEQSSVMQLVGQYLTIQTTLPDGTTEVYRRSVTPQSFSGEEVRDQSNPDEEMRRGLLQSYTIMIGSGGFPENYIMDKYFERLLAVLDAFKSFAKTENPNVAFKDVPTSWPGAHVFLSSLSAMNPAARDVVSYIWRPMVALYADYLTKDGNLRNRVDILSNSRRVLEIKGSEVVTLPSEALWLGVWDTLLESLVIDGKQAEQSLGTATVFAAAELKEIELRVLFPEDVLALESLRLSGLAKKHLRRDLEAGFAVIVPMQMPFHQEDETGWWRVHTVTGETLGMLSNGGGIQLTERVIVDIVSGVAVTGACIAALVVYGKLVNADALTYAAGVMTCIGLGTLFVADIPQAVGYGMGVIGAIIMFVQFEVQRQAGNP